MKASEQLEAALAVFDEVAKREDVHVDMMVYFERMGTRCVLCFAGASMLKDRKGELPESMGPKDFVNWRKYDGLSYLNFGCLNAGVLLLTGQNHRLPCEFSVPRYEDGKEAWRKAMDEMVTYLKERDL